MKTKTLAYSAVALGMLVALFVFSSESSAAPALACTNTASGNWSTVSWGGSCPAGPAAGDDVTIASGTTVTYNVTTTVQSLTVTGILSMNGLANTSRTMTITGNMAINGTGTIQPTNQTGANVHTLIVGGDFTNNGAFTGAQSNDAINVTFNGTANQSVSGTGTNAFNNITINNTGAANNNIVEITASNFSASAGFLTLAAGVFKFSTGATITPNSGTFSLGSGVGFILNNAGAVVNMGNNPVTVSGGDFQLLAGTMNMGNGSSVFSVTGGTATLSGGILNINGRLTMTGGTTTINGATVNIDPQSTTSVGASSPIFEATGAANVIFTSGTVIIIDPHAATGAGNEVQVVVGGTKNFAGSTIQLGDGVSTTAGSVDGFEVNCGSGVTLGNLVVNNPSGTNRFVRLVSNNCILAGNLTITAGEFQLNGRNLTLAGNFTNNGTFTPGANTVAFNGSSSQNINGATTFANLTISNTLGVSLNANGTVTGTLTLTTGDLDTGLNTLTMATGSTTTSTANDVVGNVFRDAPSVGSPLSYGSQWTTIQFNTSAPTAMTVSLTKPITAPFQGGVKRQYTLTATGIFSNADLQFHVNANDLTELNGNSVNNTMNLYRFSGTTWLFQGATLRTNAGASSWVSLNSVSTFSPWGLASKESPTAVTLSKFNAGIVESKVMLHWTTGSELNTVGFNIYRSDNLTGPYVRINPQLVPASSQAIGGGNYAFEDVSALPGRAYHYQLEDVELDGASVRHAPISVLVPNDSAPGVNLWLGALGAFLILLISGGAYLARKRRA